MFRWGFTKSTFYINTREGFHSKESNLEPGKSYSKVTGKELEWFEWCEQHKQYITFENFLEKISPSPQIQLYPL